MAHDGKQATFTSAARLKTPNHMKEYWQQCQISALQQQNAQASVARNPHLPRGAPHAPLWHAATSAAAAAQEVSLRRSSITTPIVLPRAQASNPIPLVTAAPAPMSRRGGAGVPKLCPRCHRSGRNTHAYQLNNTTNKRQKACLLPVDTSQCTDDCLSLIHISEPTRLLSISYAVFCLKKKKQTPYTT
eukprot:TRINITY_DN46397_c0_g1_i2.p1 TRINITY_DN46397_c0_g1~~TRINITY_DN46397_c0_g1_i2.p1  ORF type:complete len:188 (-),score=23.67 TRINITY_DN46397_c0_g1_i2:63-626(-)